MSPIAPLALWIDIQFTEGYMTPAQLMFSELRKAPLLKSDAEVQFTQGFEALFEMRLRIELQIVFM